MPTQETSRAQSPLGEPALRRLLEDFVRKRVPASDVDDVVQTVLCDALAAEVRPADGEELRKWLLGIARHKVADHHRRAVREPATELPEIEAHPPPLEARALARWAEEQAASTTDAQKTLAWMAREGEGEKLENIAAEENVPAARVRQRVSRMRRWMKERWIAELAAVAALALLAVLAWRILRRPDDTPEARPDKLAPLPKLTPELPDPMERARSLRADALKSCDQAAWLDCVEKLDEAAKLDPAGDRDPVVQGMRERAAKNTLPIPEATQQSPIFAPPTSTTPPAPAPTPTPTSFLNEKNAPAPTPTSTSSFDELDSKSSPKKVAPVTTPTETPKAPAPKTTKAAKPAPKLEPFEAKPRGSASFDTKKKASGSKSGGVTSLGTLGSPD